MKITKVGFSLDLFHKNHFFEPFGPISGSFLGTEGAPVDHQRAPRFSSTVFYHTIIFYTHENPKNLIFIGFIP